MDTIFMNSKNIETSDPNRLLLNLSIKKKKLKRSDKYVAVSNLSLYYTWKIMKNVIEKIDLKYKLQHGMKNLNYLMNRILYQILKIILNISLKNMEKGLIILQ